MPERIIFDPWVVVGQGDVLAVVECKHRSIVVCADSVFEKRNVAVTCVVKPPSVYLCGISCSILINNDSGKRFLEVCVTCITVQGCHVVRPIDHAF